VVMVAVGGFVFCGRACVAWGRGVRAVCLRRRLQLKQPSSGSGSGWCAVKVFAVVDQVRV